MTALAPGSSSAAALLNPVNPSIATISMCSRQVLSGREASQVLKTFLERPGYHVQEPGGTATVSYGSHVQDDGDVFVAVGGVAPHVSTRLAPVATYAHAQDRGAPLAGYVRQAPEHRVTTDALAPAASTPPVLTSNAASQHCMVWLNALARHLQPQVIQVRERAQVRAIKDSIGHVEVFRMDAVGAPIIERPRPLPGHDTPNAAHNTYTLNYEEPVKLKGLTPAEYRDQALQQAA